MEFYNSLSFINDKKLTESSEAFLSYKSYQFK